MKKFFAMFMVAVMCFGLAGCGVSQSDYDSLQNLNNGLTENLATLEDEHAIALANIAQLEGEVEALTLEIETLSEELDYLQNGPSSLLNQAKIYYGQGNYQGAITTASKLCEEFSGTNEALEGQSVIEESNLRVAEITAEAEAKAAEAEAEAEAKALAEAEEAAKSAQEKARDLITINSVYSSSPNSAGGVSAYIKWKNNSSNTIKYINFLVSPRNGVDDEVECEIRNHGSIYLQGVGPFEKGQGNTGSRYWDCMWYNSTIKSLVLLKVQIEYMDGSKTTIDGSEFGYQW